MTSVKWRWLWLEKEACFKQWDAPSFPFYRYFIHKGELRVHLAKFPSQLRWENIPEIIITHGSPAKFTSEPNVRHSINASTFCHSAFNFNSSHLSALYFLTIAILAFPALFPFFVMHSTHSLHFQFSTLPLLPDPCVCNWFVGFYFIS